MVDPDCTTSLTSIPFQQTGYFSKTICDYLDQKESLRPFYHNTADLEGLNNQVLEKQNSFTTATRTVLVEALKKQYQGLAHSEKTAAHIDALADDKTFTVTTGHQLNLFTGPLYFLYKIISTINLAEALNKAHPGYHFVPVYWMASEDHDFDEINYFNFKGTKLEWKRACSGGVGRLDTSGLDGVLAEFDKLLPKTDNANYLKELFTKGYLEHNTLVEATRYIANDLFKEYGLVIVDGDDRQLKQLFAPFVKDELLHQTSYKKVSQTIDALQTNYSIQVNPREINLFYLDDGLRERIIKEESQYKVNNTDLSFSEQELLTILKEHPERFSPNALLRPLYQEVILPNICYIGGGGELAYWFELKSYFETVKVPYPVLLLRNSVLLCSVKQHTKLEKLNLSTAELFLNNTS